MEFIKIAEHNIWIDKNLLKDNQITLLMKLFNKKEKYVNACDVDRI